MTGTSGILIVSLKQRKNYSVSLQDNNPRRKNLKKIKHRRTETHSPQHALAPKCERSNFMPMWVRQDSHCALASESLRGHEAMACPMSR